MDVAVTVTGLSGFRIRFLRVLGAELRLVVEEHGSPARAVALPVELVAQQVERLARVRMPVGHRAATPPGEHVLVHDRLGTALGTERTGFPGLLVDEISLGEELATGGAVDLHLEVHAHEGLELAAGLVAGVAAEFGALLVALHRAGELRCLGGTAVGAAPGGDALQRLEGVVTFLDELAQLLEAAFAFEPDAFLVQGVHLRLVGLDHEPTEVAHGRDDPSAECGPDAHHVVEDFLPHVRLLHGRVQGAQALSFFFRERRVDAVVGLDLTKRCLDVQLREIALGAEHASDHRLLQALLAGDPTLQGRRFAGPGTHAR